jgi:hypothetical protein
MQYPGYGQFQKLLRLKPQPLPEHVAQEGNIAAMAVSVVIKGLHMPEVLEDIRLMLKICYNVIGKREGFFRVNLHTVADLHKNLGNPLLFLLVRIPEQKKLFSLFRADGLEKLIYVKVAVHLAQNEKLGAFQPCAALLCDQQARIRQKRALSAV